MKKKPAKHLPGKGKGLLLGVVLVLAASFFLLGHPLVQYLFPRGIKVYPAKRAIHPPLERSKPPLPLTTSIVTGPEKKAEASIILEDPPKWSGPLFQRPKERATEPKKKGEFLISIIVDDLGYQYRPVRDLIWSDFPLTIAVLPFQTFTKRVADEVLASGKDLMLHLPMEPFKYPKKNPGKGALLASMTPAEVLDQLKENIQALPGGLKGINNHMGSRFMEDEERVAVVIREIQRRGLFFVDSLTTNRSKGRRLSNFYSLPMLSRDIYLDNDQQTERIRRQFGKLIAIAKKRGWAIGICHPYPETISVLMKVLPELEKEGVKLVPISYLTQRPS
jgi:polysaccharide deacetylase 2 family uncharacterized protein YibQ